MGRRFSSVKRMYPVMRQHEKNGAQLFSVAIFRRFHWEWFLGSDHPFVIKHADFIAPRRYAPSAKAAQEFDGHVLSGEGLGDSLDVGHVLDRIHLLHGLRVDVRQAQRGQAFGRDIQP